MDEQIVRAEPLEYYSSDETGWRLFVRVCAYVAMAQAMLLLLVEVSQFVMVFGSGNPARLFRDARNIVGVGMELLVGIACVAVIALGGACARGARGANRSMIAAAAALATAQTLRGIARSWSVISYYIQFPARRPAGEMFAVAIANLADLGLTLLIPLLIIWLMRRPETRRLFNAG